MAQLIINFDSAVDVIDSGNFCENGSESFGDRVKFSYVDDDGNDHYSTVWPLDLCVL